MAARPEGRAPPYPLPQFYSSAPGCDDDDDDYAAAAWIRGGEGRPPSAGGRGQRRCRRGGSDGFFLFAKNIFACGWFYRLRK